jgi:hypothetical protein
MVLLLSIMQGDVERKFLQFGAISQDFAQVREVVERLERVSAEQH